jgi:hypothetical protein
MTFGSNPGLGSPDTAHRSWPSKSPWVKEAGRSRFDHEQDAQQRRDQELDEHSRICPWEQLRPCDCAVDDPTIIESSSRISPRRVTCELQCGLLVIAVVG